NRSESKEAALIAGLIQGVVAFMSATLILIGAVLLVLFAIFTAFLEICSGIMPSGP
ncbi:MAG: putative membrane protein, partial [Pirellulaceae bacterium]